MEVGRRKKEEAVIAMVSAIKNVLTVLAVGMDAVQPKRGASSFRHSEPVPHPKENWYNILFLSIHEPLKIQN